MEDSQFYPSVIGMFYFSCDLNISKIYTIGRVRKNV